MKSIYTLAAFLFIAFALQAQTPYASYPLDGNANDVSGNNLNGSINGTVTAAQNRYNINSKALTFNGSTNYIDLPSDFDFPSRSVVVWFNASQIPAGNNGGVVYNSDHSGIQNGANYILVNNDGVSNVIRMGMDNALYYGTMNTNQWYQVAMVRSPAFVKFYVNGVLVYTLQNPNGTHANNGVSYAVVGADRGHNSKFIGRIDDLHIYNDTLSAAQIENNYSSLKDVREIEDKLIVTTLDNKISYSIPAEYLEQTESVMLYDMAGRVLRTQSANTNGHFESAMLPTGTYTFVITLKNSSSVVAKKLVVQ
ncbi:MAG: T9SS type A sorting domain-containing protein [Chitinophagales bacterium]|nr:T9SS type A sorting domain-containing protein [Chitinophagales bacterium]